MYKNTNCFHLAIPCGDLEIAKKFYSETLGCRLDNSAQEWADVDFWGNELTLRLKDSGTKYYDEPYLRFKGTKYEQETFFVKDPNENILEIKTLTANPE